MRRVLIFGLGSLLVAGLLVIGAFVFFGGLWRRTKPDIEKVGGIMLVYEFDREEPLNEETMFDCVNAVQGRMPWHCAVRARGNKRLEIVIPRYKNLAGDVEEVKKRMALAGTLEFRILANQLDDSDMLDELHVFFADAAKDGKEQMVLLNAAK
jgi:hypothetical protein